MQKILQLDSKLLRTGRTRSQFDDTGGIWDAAQGLNPYLESDTYRGLVALGSTPTDKTGSVVVDIPVAYAKIESGSTYTLYILGLSGHFYSVNVNEAVTDLRSGTPINVPANGMAIFRPRAASAATMLFARQARIGTWDLSGTYPTGWNDTAYDPGTSTPHRPMHRLFDRVYYGNKNYIGMFSDDGTATIVHTAQALNLEGQETVTALGDDGRYLIAGVSRAITESYNGLNRVRLIFWDGNKSSWDWETEIPNETSIRGIRRSGDIVHVFGKRGAYTVSFGTGVKPLYLFDSDEAIAFDALNYGHVGSLASWGDGIIFGKLGTAISKMLPGDPRIVFNPLQGFTGEISLIIPDFLENKVYVGTRSSKLYSYDLTTAGASSTPLTTRFLNLDGRYHVERLSITLPNGIGASDSIAISIAGIDGTSATLSTITQAYYGNQYFLSIPLPKQITTTHAKLSVTMSAGTPSFADIALWGTPATQ
ncbi:MAG: hypothetical protein KF889_01570 [Alphaproteobacteria bacterium]|nr:hypothetical protein [Alphaproteobacteria bacterium]MCW5741594.1 hypothetical protein [Alphaproteobacteria bacterium]